jgi:phage/plasmid-like protein (TIGR03299 family)
MCYNLYRKENINQPFGDTKMTAAIEVKGGVASMMYAGETPWHGLGTKVEKEVTAAAAIKLAGLDWTCDKHPIYLAGKNQVDGIPVIGTKIEDKVAVVRNGDGAVLGLVSEDYHIIQNEECFGFLDEIVGSGQAIFHTAGALFGGRVIFCTIKLPTDAKVGDDLINKYLLMKSAHDGTSALHVRWTPIRVVCANTLSVAMSKKSDAQVSIRHTSKCQPRIEEARKVLRLADEYYQVMEKQFNALLNQKFSDGDMKTFSETLFPQQGEELAGITRKRRERVVDLFSTGRGNAAVKNTRWAAFNAITEYADHFMTVRPEKHDGEVSSHQISEARMISITDGTGSRLKQKAFDLLAAVA